MSDIYVSLPVVRIDKGNCELEITYLDKRGSIDSSICVIRKRLSFSDELDIDGLHVYEWNSIYYHNIEAMADAKIIAIPISLDPIIYYLVKKKSYNKKRVDILYGIYAKLYWNKKGVSTDISYSYFERLSTVDMFSIILDI